MVGYRCEVAAWLNEYKTPARLDDFIIPYQTALLKRKLFAIILKDFMR